MTALTHLLLVDPQNDFCDLPLAMRPGRLFRPALPVPGAHQDMLRVADFIRRNTADIDAITITLDSHQSIDIAHNTFWINAEGQTVAPFTAITVDDIESGTYRPRQASALSRALDYTRALRERGRYTLVAWPEHCVLGTWGHNVHSDVMRACLQWSAVRHSEPLRVLKGMNPWTEHYSALAAEVADPDDASTQTNTALLARLSASERLLVAGQASSHCVRATVEDLIRLGLPGERIILLTDCMSPVAGCASLQQAFFDFARDHRIQLATSQTALMQREPSLTP
ncbi:cysteine hydrolase [Amphibiibacter pelophylacis]|uniref:Cysteine hydrolase n=1 Tax=Amphibiibacter pelophylacis TaxID=1799477 RepID=A0ACC6P429_9BURK